LKNKLQNSVCKVIMKWRNNGCLNELKLIYNQRVHLDHIDYNRSS
jgi:hypothetical protein